MVLNRVVRALDTALNVFVLILCALILLISTYSLIDNYRQYRATDDPALMEFKPSAEDGETITEEKRITENQVAWLTIDDTVIDYPVLQGKDNSEYLNKDPYGEFKLSGSIFLDYRNDKLFTDDYSLIYGHHMEHGAMFGSLDEFTDVAFFDAHKTGWLITEAEVYRLTLFAVSNANGSNQTFFSPKGRTISEITGFLKENALIYHEPEAGCQIVALSTCAGDDYFARLIVFGYLMEQQQKQSEHEKNIEDLN